MPLGRVVPIAVLAAALLVASVDAGAGPPSEAVPESLTAVNRLLDDPELRERPTELVQKLQFLRKPGIDPSWPASPTSAPLADAPGPGPYAEVRFSNTRG